MCFNFQWLSIPNVNSECVLVKTWHLAAWVAYLYCHPKGYLRLLLLLNTVQTPFPICQVSIYTYKSKYATLG